jgi:hypothetical protein
LDEKLQLMIIGGLILLIGIESLLRIHWIKTLKEQVSLTKKIR